MDFHCLVSINYKAKKLKLPTRWQVCYTILQAKGVLLLIHLRTESQSSFKQF